MSLTLSHIALATREIQEAAKRLSALGLEIDEEKKVPSEKVKVGFVPVPVSENFRLELLEPTSEDSPISKFLEKKPLGGIHHLSFEVTGIEEWKKKLESKGFEILAPGVRKAARGRALFIHPKSFGGVLVELEEIE